MEVPEEVNRLKKCLERHSKESGVTIDKHKDSYILQFDLVIDDSDNRWGDIQPKVSAVSVKNGFIDSYNIRLGSVDSEEMANRMKSEVIKSRPPCLDQFDTGHSSDVIQPHIRMDDDMCSIKEFERFINRFFKLI